MSGLPLQAVFHGNVDPNMRSVLQYMWEEIAKALNSSSAGVVTDTHSNHVSGYNAADYPLGTLFWESDRKVLYINANQGSGNTWYFLAGYYRSLLANKPTLTTSDAGFIFIASDKGQHFYWTGTAWLEEQQVEDAATVTVVEVLRLIHTTSGVAGIGFGARLAVMLENAAGTQVDGSSLDTTWTVATAGAENSSWTVRLRAAGAALVDWFQVLTTGIKFKVGAFFAIFIHANTADRTYTLADADGNLVYETSALTDHAIVLGNGGAKAKPGTLGTTVTVLHGNAAGDPTYGAVSLTTDVSGVLPLANGGTNANSAVNARASLSAAQIQAPGGPHTVPLAKLTGGGVNGSITFNAEGVITGFVDPT